jgi:adenylate kinase family enzyme
MNRRIAIIGNAGGGKTTLARSLSERLGIARHSIDDVQWLPGWIPAPLDVVARHHDEWMREPAWIIDGWGAWNLIEQRFAAADTIVFIDYSFVRHLWWAMRRIVHARMGRRGEWPPPGCDVRGITLPLLRVMWRVHTQWRPRLLALMAEPRITADVVHLRSPRAMIAFRDGVAP